VLAQVNPLHQLVELVRAACFGFEASDVLRLLFLVAFALLTWRIAIRQLTKRLIN
jgi:ABC-type polysaccharide/polyol phosphate export permease